MWHANFSKQSFRQQLSKCVMCGELLLLIPKLFPVCKKSPLDVAFCSYTSRSYTASLQAAHTSRVTGSDKGRMDLLQLTG